MNSAMKQRLIGTVVIGSLAIIFIPVLLDGEGVSPPEMTGSIPDSTPMPVVPEIVPFRPEITADSVSIAESELSNAAEPATGSLENTRNDLSTTSAPPAPERPKLDTAGIPETWTVRLGSFGEKANADALVARLREQSYKGFSRPLNSSRGLLTGVYVGPVLTESEAGKLQQELAGEFELEGVVVQFTIEELEQ